MKKIILEKLKADSRGQRFHSGQDSGKTREDCHNREGIHSRSGGVTLKQLNRIFGQTATYSCRSTKSNLFAFVLA